MSVDGGLLEPTHVLLACPRRPTDAATAEAKQHECGSLMPAGSGMTLLFQSA